VTELHISLKDAVAIVSLFGVSATLLLYVGRHLFQTKNGCDKTRGTYEALRQKDKQEAMEARKEMYNDIISHYIEVKEFMAKIEEKIK
jgi:hypothetical protein